MSNSVLITVVAAIVLVLATPLIAKAQQVPVPTAGEATWSGGSILTDQDLWVDRLGVNSNRNYTMGVGFQFNGAFVKRLPDAKLHFLLDRGVSGLLGAVGVGPVQPSLVRGTNNIFERNFHGITFAASGFTPDELTAVAPVIGDRPYGSIVVLSTQRMFVLQGPDETWAVSTELGLGVIGLGISGWIQTEIHKRNSSPIPEGWDNQISDGGDPAFYYRVNVLRRLSPPKANPADYQIFDATADAETYLGYYTNASLGLNLRLGYFFSRFYEFSSAPLGAVAQAVGGQQQNPRAEGFVFFALRPRAIGYNALLQGWLKDGNRYELSSSQIERLILETQAGVHGALRVGQTRYATLTFLINRRSHEFNTPLARAHWYGSLNLGIIQPVF